MEAAITPRTKAILIGYPNNPTGAVATRETLLEVAAIAEKHDLVVISDEIYDRLVYGVEHVCLPRLPGMRRAHHPAGRLLQGLCHDRLAHRLCRRPGGDLTGMLRVHQYTIMSAPTMAQDAAVEALVTAEDYVQEMVAEYDRRRKLIVGGLNQLGLPTFEPHGAFYAFPKITVTGMDDETFAQPAAARRTRGGGAGDGLWRRRRGLCALLVCHRLRKDSKRRCAGWTASCAATDNL